MAEWAEENAKRQATRRNKKICVVFTDVNDNFEVIADARLKPNQNTVLAFPCIEKKQPNGTSSNFYYNWC